MPALAPPKTFGILLAGLLEAERDTLRPPARGSVSGLWVVARPPVTKLVLVRGTEPHLVAADKSVPSGPELP